MRTMLGRPCFLLTVLLLLVPAAAPALADFDERLALEADKLVLYNLIGAITVEGHGGSGFEIEIRARGRDANRSNLEIETIEGSTAEVRVKFPLARETRYVYPPMGSGSRANIDTHSREGGLGGFVSRLFGAGSSRIKVSGSGSGMELWADVIVRVPTGAGAEIRHGVGTIVAEGVEGGLTLANHSGTIEARRTAGDLLVDTGSGKAVLDSVRGNVSVDTGSGRVELTDVEGDRVEADTGSGSIRFTGVRARTVVMDTGSGRISGSGLAADEARMDTGSGSIEAEFDRVGEGNFDFDTGSGSIRLRLPADASATIYAETGSGGIQIDVAGADVRRMERNEAEIVIGGGAARFRLDTGSGAIRISN